MTDGKKTAKSKLDKAFFELLEKKHYSKITVTELIERADVSRTTFYRNYVDIFDMYDKMCAAVLESLIEELVENFKSRDNIRLSDAFEAFIIKLSGQHRYIALLCGPHGNISFFEFALKKIFDYSQEIGADLDEKELFAMKFIVLSGASSYIRKMVVGDEFPKEFLPVSKRLFDLIQGKEVC